MMTIEHGIGMLLVGIVVIMIGVYVMWRITNKNTEEEGWK